MHETDDSLPVDPDLDAALKLPDAVGALRISGTNEDGNVYEGPDHARAGCGGYR
jgi:hypothetical protein